MTDIQEQLDDTEYDPTQVEYAESERPYMEVLKKDEIDALLQYQECENLIEEGIIEKNKGNIKQLRGAYTIWRKQLWKFALSQVSQRRFKSQEQWIQECIDSHDITAFARSNFFDKVRVIDSAVNIGKPLEEALRLGVNHTSIEEAEQAGALTITATRDGKTTKYIPTITEFGHTKLLKDGLKTLPEFYGDTASMSSRDALKSVRHDVGRTYGYFSAIVPYAGDTPFFDESKAHVFAIEYTFVDPNNGSTPYQMKLLIEGDMDKKKIEMALRVLRGEFRL